VHSFLFQRLNLPENFLKIQIAHHYLSISNFADALALYLEVGDLNAAHRVFIDHLSAGLLQDLSNLKKPHVVEMLQLFKANQS
jgi:hypothetical protein